ncbi:MAG TPA: tetratricopeptide repeat protein [Pyrinomonadaceae bacterium]|jgi:Tfp pilus assembly protein PilF|nr:tetratricopeptide repeat protein [Pyrinomonadaceae bacterium]
MNWIVRRLPPVFPLLIVVFVTSAPAEAQDVKLTAVVSNRPAVTVLDSTKEQDGLVGSVRRVKTETAKIELKDGRAVEGLPQLVEVTTYGVKGNRIENTSYPIESGPVGKEEYKYDERGNITEMTVRDDHGAILSREAYSYEFDKFGNWTKMVTSLVVFENGELKREPTEVTYRTVTYYFDDAVAKIVEEPKVANAPAVPEPSSSDIRDQQVLEFSVSPVLIASDVEEPPPLLKSVSSEAKSATDNTDKNDLISAEAQLSLGHEFLKQQKDREAIKAFKESIKLNPNIAETYYGLGFSNFRLGKFRDAADAFKKATVLSPTMAKAHYGLSLAYQELGMTSQLIDEYRILERLDRTLAKRLAQTFPQYNFSCRLVQGCP